MNMNISTLIVSAQRHGQESEPDMEIGDLQAALRIAWSLLDEAARGEFIELASEQGLLDWRDP